MNLIFFTAGLTFALFFELSRQNSSKMVMICLKTYDNNFKENKFKDNYFLSKDLNLNIT